MRMRVKLKGQDDYIRVDTLNDRDQNLLKAKGLNYKYISFNRRRGYSQVIEELQHGKVAIPFDDLISRLKSEDGEIFEYLSGLNPHQLWIEINRNKNNVNMSKESWSKIHLGLKRLSYHHVTNTGTKEYITRGQRGDNVVMFFYKGLDRLIKDIKEKINERNSKDKGDSTATFNNNR